MVANTTQVAGRLDKIDKVYGKACAWSTIDHAGPIHGSAKKDGHKRLDMQEQPIFNLLIVHWILAKKGAKKVKKCIQIAEITLNQHDNSTNRNKNTSFEQKDYRNHLACQIH